jgi:dolichol kinase
MAASDLLPLGASVISQPTDPIYMQYAVFKSLAVTIYLTILFMASAPKACTQREIRRVLLRLISRFSNRLLPQRNKKAPVGA